MASDPPAVSPAPWRERIRVVIFETGTPAGKAFDVALLVAILPSYLSLVLPGSESLLVIRALRLLRVFRVFKLVRFLGEASVLGRALAASRHKITVFLGTIAILITILGAAMYRVEGAENGFTSIPTSIYWAIVTMTTVGYGDIAPQTVIGEVLASIAMIIGYGIIAVPTGIVTAELFDAAKATPNTTRTFPECLGEGHLWSARFCRDCGARLGTPPSEDELRDA